MHRMPPVLRDPAVVSSLAAGVTIAAAATITTRALWLAPVWAVFAVLGVRDARRRARA